MGSCKSCCYGVFKGITNRLPNLDHRPFDEIILIEEGYSEQMDKKYFRMALEEDGSCRPL